MSEYLKISEEIRALGAEAEREIRPYFSRIEEICDRNTEKVLAAFAKTTAAIRSIKSMPIFSAQKLLSCASALSTARMPCPAQCSPQ